jgi:signal transduction histidine kinase
MRKLFFRTFLSIISVAVIIILFIIASISLFYNSATNDWVEQSFETFSQKVASSVSNAQGEMSFGKFIQITDSAALSDKRISGLLFRGPNDKIIYSLGVTQLGEKLAQIQSSEPNTTTKLLKGQDLDESEFVTISVRDRVNILNLTDDKVTLQVVAKKDTDTRNLEVPPMIKEKFIGGSLIVLLRGQYAFSVDVLNYSPSTYAATSMIMRQAAKWLSICFMIALLIAFIMSYRISKISQKSITEIKDSLNKLALGKENLELSSHNKIEEYQEIIESIHSLDESLAANRKNRKAWLNSITHDLNTPITSMNLLLSGMEDGIFPLNQQTVKTLKNEQQDLSNKINRVVLYSSLQSPEKAIIPQATESRVLVDDLIRSNIKYKTVKFNIESDEIYCDFTTMKLAIKELLDNALEVSKEGVEVTIKENNIVVTNPGTIDDTVDFFEPWERGDKSRTSGGNGLGLAIVSQIIKLHSGTSTIKQVEKNVEVNLFWQIED